MRFPSHHRTRPQLLLLEDRLPLGDGVLGLLAGASLLPGSPLAVRARSVSEGGAGTTFADASGSDPTTGFAPGTGRDETFWARATADALAAPSWRALTDPFAPAARRQHGASAPSPQREQGPPLLARRAETGGAGRTWPPS